MSFRVRAVDQARRTLHHPLVRSTGWVASSTYLSALLGLVLTVVVARYLGTRAYGIYALTVGFPLLVWSFAGTKAQSITIGYLSRYKEDDPARFAAVAKAGYLLDAMAALMALVLVASVAPFVAAALEVDPVFAIAYASSFPFYSCVGASHAVLTSLGEFKSVGVLQVLDKAIALIVVIAILTAVRSSEAAVAATALAQVLVGVIATAIVARTLRRRRIQSWWKASLSVLGPERREALGLFGWNYLTVTMNGVVGQAPLLVVGSVAGPVAAGLFRVASNVATAVTYVEAALWRVAYPVIAERASKRDPDLPEAIRRWVRRGSLPAAVAGLLGLPLMPVLIPAVFGRQFSPAGTGTMLMMVGSLVSLVFFYVNPIFYSLGLVKEWVAYYAPFAVLLLVGVWLATERWGFIGAAGAIAIGMVLFNFTMAARAATLLRAGARTPA